MQPQIVTAPAKNLIGMKVNTSLAEAATEALWKRFMPRRKEIQGVVDSRLYSVEDYGQEFDPLQFTPQTTFEKWAAVEVSEFENIPKGMDSLTLPEGKYAIFIHKGIASDFPQTAQFIFGTWLPRSGYLLDDRPHFEIMGEKYLGHQNPDSEEEVWIPIVQKQN